MVFNKDSFIKINSATVFNRSMLNGQAFALGVIALNTPYEVSDNFHYFIDFDDTPGLIPETIDIDYHEPGVCWKYLTVNEKMRAKYWPALRYAEDHKIFVAGVIPLIPEKGVFCFYGPMRRSLFSQPGDSFHQFDGKWNHIESPISTRGETPDQIFKNPIWHIDGIQYSITPMGDAMMLHDRIAKETYIECHLAGKSHTEFIDRLNENLSSKIIDGTAPQSLLASHYNDKEYMDYLVNMNLAGALFSNRLLTADEYRAKEHWSKQCFNEFKNADGFGI